MNLIKKNKKSILIFLLIFFLALGLRIINLTILPVFADEAIYIRWAQVMRAEAGLRFLPLSDGKQPLFMWVVIPFLKIFTDALFAGRIVSVFSGIGSLIGVFVLARLLFKSERAALISAFVYAVSPFAVFFDRLALSDPLLAMFGVWSVVFTILASRTLRLDYALLAGFALGFALLTKSPALFFSLSLPFVFLLNSDILSKKNLKLSKITQSVFLIIATTVLGYGMYNILRLGPEFHMIAIRNQDYIFPLNHVLVSPFNPFIGHIKDILSWIWIMGPGLIFLFILLGIRQGWKTDKTSLFTILLLILFPLAVQSVYAKVFTARYIFFTFPFMAVLAGASFKNVTSLTRKLLYVALILFAIMALRQDVFLLTSPDKADLPRSERSGYLEEWTAGFGIKESANYLKELHSSDPGQTIVVGTEGYFGTLPDGLQIYLNAYPQIIVKGVGIDLTQVDGSLLESRQAGNPTFLLINSSRLKIENPAEQGLKLIENYPKAPKPSGEQENLYFFEVI